MTSMRVRILFVLYLPSNQYSYQRQHPPEISHGWSLHHSGQCPEPDIAKWEYAMSDAC
jgi:hypothetical protein